MSTADIVFGLAVVVPVWGCLFFAVRHLPSLDAAIQTWTAKQNVEHQRVEVWAEGYQEGREHERLFAEERRRTKPPKPSKPF